MTSVGDLIAYARANPGKLNYGSSGNGATNHMGAELFKSLAKVDMVHVPFKGGGDALTALLSGQIQVLFKRPVISVIHGDKDAEKRLSSGMYRVALSAIGSLLGPLRGAADAYWRSRCKTRRELARESSQGSITGIFRS